MTGSELGAFLRAARARIEPADVGLPTFGVRRVVGLRREEIATLAGVSADYYTRLEQGRERTPSGQVVDAIGRALQLSSDAREHMLRLAGVIPSSIHAGVSEQVSPEMLKLLEAVHEVGAYVSNRRTDVLALNARARQMMEPMGEVDNIARFVFCNPKAKDFVRDWKISAESIVQSLRLAAGFHPQDDLVDLVAELSAASDEFSALWEDNRPLARAPIANSFLHKTRGVIAFTSVAFDIRGSTGQQLVLLVAQRDPPTGSEFRADHPPSGRARVPSRDAN